MLKNLESKPNFQVSLIKVTVGGTQKALAGA